MDKDQEKFLEPQPADDKTQAKSPVGLIDAHSAGSPKDLQQNEIVADRYKVLSLIGRGAMGSVYRVEQLSIQKHLALKTLNPIAATSINVRRFKNEALAASKLEHPNLVRALDCGWIGNQPFMVMDLVDGPTLSHYLKRHASLPLSTCFQIFIPICFALAYAHEEGVIHRDLKPSNIVLASDPKNKDLFIPRVVDFGIAKLSTEEEALTKTGEVFGTPLYMSPEQCLGMNIDHRSDIYSLGCVLYEALTGAPPFSGQSALETMIQHRESKALPLKEAALGANFPAGMQQIVNRMLEKDPALRYQNCLDVAQDLTLVQQGRSDLLKRVPNIKPTVKEKSADRRTAIIIGLICVSLAGAAAWWLSQRHDQIGAQAIDQPSTLSSSVSPDTIGGGTKSTTAVDTSSSEQQSVLPELTRDNYSQIRNGKREFNFGKRKIGTISLMKNSVDLENMEPRPAVGDVSFAKDKMLLLDVRIAEVHDDPSVFGRFRADDLRGLKVHKQGFDDFTGTFNYDSALAFASKLTALEYLKLEGHATIVGLDNMHVERMHLRSLNVNHTDVDGKDLARLDKVLRQLYYIDVGNLRNVSKILKSLQGSKNLTWLGVENANLTNSDLTVIASMSNLRDLNLTGNSVISDATLSKFANLRALQNIVLSGTNVTPACSKELAKYPRLEGVHLPARFRSFEKDIRADLHDRRLIFQD